MEAYLNSLGQNVDIQTEWAAYKAEHFKYDPTHNYFAEALSLALKDNKYSENSLDEKDYVVMFKERMFNVRRHAEDCLCGNPKHLTYFCDNWRDLTPDEIKHRVYNEFIALQYKRFKRKWTPKDTDSGLKYMFITLNYSNDLSLNQIMVETSRIINLPIISPSKVTYCYERFTKEGEHTHVHMLVELNKTGTVAMSKFLDDVYKKKSLKSLLKVDYKFSWAKDFNKRCQSRAVCLAYIMGNKIDEKMENVGKDLEFRQNNNLEPFYIKENA